MARRGEVALTKGKDFTGVAGDTEILIANELHNDGLTSMYRVRGCRLQTVADLYYQAILGATTIADLDKFCQRYGWLQASALRALVVLRDLEKDQANEPIDVVEVRRRLQNDINR